MSKSEIQVVDDKLLINAIISERDGTFGNATEEPEDFSLVETSPKIENLVLSFRKIGRIENLVGFDSLLKLCLDNNFIEDIVNLGHLSKLRWLDLSFNRIRRIQGLENLVLLEDLTLFNNRISIVEGLDQCTRLQCLSLGNNKIDSMEQVIKLRQIKSLRMLTLSGNPVCKENDYRMSIYAFLDSLRYLDYALIDINDRNTAKEQYHDELLDVEEKESVIAEKESRDKALAEYLKRLDEIGILFAHTLIEDMFVGDADIDRLRHLPGVKESIDQTKNQFKVLSEDFVKNSQERFDRKTKEINDFERTVKYVQQREDTESTQLIEGFYRSKKVISSQITDPRSELRKSERQAMVKKLNEELERVSASFNCLQNRNLFYFILLFRFVMNC